MLQLSGKRGNKRYNTTKNEEKKATTKRWITDDCCRRLWFYIAVSNTFQLVCENAAHISSEHNVFRFPFVSPEKYRLFVAILSTDRPVYVSSYRLYVVCQFEKSSFVCEFSLHVLRWSLLIHKHLMFDALHNIDLAPTQTTDSQLHTVRTSRQRERETDCHTSTGAPCNCLHHSENARKTR